ncbi:MAG: M28 family peptidase [Chitinophagaceae bacterium]
MIVLRSFTAARILTAASLISLLVLAKETHAQAKKPAKAKSATTASLDSTTLINDLAFLASDATEGRAAGTPGNIMAQQYIAKRFDSLGLIKTNGTYLQPFTFSNNNTNGTNVVGVIKGTRYPDSYIILSAHYDHLGKRDGKIYYGADDDASGTACVMALAKYFKQHPPLHSLVLATFDAEERGLQGSKYYADHPFVSLDKMMIDVSLDMISRNDSNQVYASGTFHYPFLKKYVEQIQKATPINLLMGHDDSTKGRRDDWTNQSDHYSFHKNKIPFIYFGVEDHPDYHRPTDTFDKINKRFYFQVCTMIKDMALLLDKQQSLQ